jgi:hypothetical protein
MSEGAVRVSHVFKRVDQHDEIKLPVDITDMASPKKDSAVAALSVPVWIDG